MTDLPDRVLEGLRALGVDVQRLPKIPPELAELIESLTPEDLERIKGDVVELGRMGLLPRR